MFDPAYSELLDTNQELRGELQDEIFINKSNEKKIRSLLRVLQQDKKFKDEVGSIQDGRIIELENKVGSLKARIRILIDKKISINALDMATTNLIANVNRGLDRIENHIRGVGTPMQNPANVIDGIRGSLNTIRVTLQNITAERDQYQNILNDTNNWERDYRNQLRDSRNQNLQLQRLLDESQIQVERTMRERDNAQGERDLAILAYNNEKKESCRWRFSYQNKDRRVQELIREKFAKQLLYQRNVNHHQQNTRQLQTNAQNQVNRMIVIIARKQTRIGELIREKFVFQLVIRQRDQNILNLQGQILALQNNPLGNMADARRLPVLNLIAPILAKNKPYTGQEPPDDYLDRLIQSISFAQGHMTVLENANAGDFDDAVKCNIYKAQMGGKYLPVPAQDPYNGNANINTPDTLRAWMRSHYQQETVGSRQSALQRLTQEKFLPTDSPDTYEKRIRPLLLGVADNDAQTIGFLKNHLSGDLYTWMRAVAPATINAFFTNLKDMWLEHAPNLNGGQNYQSNSSAEIEKLNSQIASLQAQLAQPAQVHPQNNEASANFEKLNSKVASLEAQLAESMQVHSKLAQRLQLPENVINSNNPSIFDSHINQELEKRLAVIEINLAKLIKLIREDTIDTKSTQYRYSESPDYNNGGLEKRLEQIEAHLAKFARKDTKSSQRQCSESSPFGGLEKRLGQIEALLAKLAKDSKSRSGRVHMATIDEQSNPIFSDDDTAKPEENGYNSDGSYSDKFSKSKISNKSELRKVKQDNNSSSAHNALSDKDSHGKRVSLEEIIRKIIQIEFENYLPYIIQQAKNCVPVLAQNSDEEDILDGPMEINFIWKKEPATDVATVKCKIKRLVIPAGTVDPGANFLIMSEDIAKRLKLEIDTKEKHDLRGIATSPTESLGIVRNVPVNFASGCTIYADFAVVKYPKPMLILPNTLLDKYNYDLFASKRELKLECNSKEFFIPINMHKVKNKLEVNCANVTPESDASSTLDHISQDLSEDSTLKKK
ncbi:hypothetical protein GLOIN_2v1773489 [Rhizophagus clarus]|uniref:Uncharacterized protein n=1 Tax=Rhizophagus clarus TaxID=94130 RepID=A0A8H3L965_9GLOM|nr:hypothetical protein GLOIN_2v1773489 [Rhizophagus clarus]